MCRKGDAFLFAIVKENQMLTSRPLELFPVGLGFSFQGLAASGPAGPAPRATLWPSSVM